MNFFIKTKVIISNDLIELFTHRDFNICFIKKLEEYGYKHVSLQKKGTIMAVEVVTDDNFNHIISTKDKVIVKYYADWCGSCKLFSPKFKRLSNDERFDSIAFLDVNAEKNPVSRKVAGVSTLPYFAIFKNGELVESISSSKEEAVVALLDTLN